jgi:RNA polymerase sigma factor (sigma-70 family)
MWGSASLHTSVLKYQLLMSETYVHNYSEEQKTVFLQLLNNHKNCLYFVLNKFYIKDENDRSDYLQEMYMLAWTRFYKYQPRPDSTFATWLIDTASWAVYSYTRKNFRRYKAHFMFPEVLPEGIEIQQPALKDDIQSLHFVVRTLPKRYQDILLLYFEGYQLNEIGEILNVKDIFATFNRIKNYIRGKRKGYFPIKAKYPEYKNPSTIKPVDEVEAAATKKVYQYTKSGDLIKSWPSINEIIKQGYYNVWGVLEAKDRKTAGGFIFSYKELTREECLEMTTRDYSDKYRAVEQYTKEGEFIRRFKSLSDVKEEGFDPPNVAACANGKRPTHKGYTWKYAVDSSNN